MLSRFVITRTVVVATLMAASAIALFLWEYQAALQSGTSDGIAISTAQTMTVTTVIMFQVFYLFSCRSLNDSIVRIGVFSNPMVFVGLAALLALQAVFVYAPVMNEIFGTHPLGLRELAIATVVGALTLPIISFDKWVRRRRDSRGRRRQPERPA